MPSPTGLPHVLGAFSLAADLGMGLSMEHGVRSCYIGMRIGQEMELSPEETRQVYRTAMLKDAGCTCSTSQLATLLMIDELTAMADAVTRNPDNAMDMLSWLVTHAARGAPAPERAKRVLDFLVHGREYEREGAVGECGVAQRIAQRLGMPGQVQEALYSCLERWDGRGMPRGLRGTAIPLASRIVSASVLVEVYHRSGGQEAARKMVRERRGKALDPSAVDAFLAVSSRPDFWEPLARESMWDLVMGMAPEANGWLADERLLDDTALAFADFADIKASETAGHSRRVAALAEVMAGHLRFSTEGMVAVRRAALMHDVGLVTIPAGIVRTTRGHLTEAQSEKLRLHPYYGERILSKVPAFEEVAVLVGAHHERVDGQG